MIVVSDASPLIALAAVGRLDLLRRLYGDVLVPEAAHHEATVAGSSAPGAAEIIAASWLHAIPVGDQALVATLSAELDAGEAEAIVLALEQSADLLLMDERRGRAVAARFGVPVTGILGALIEAKRRNLLPAIRPVLDDLIGKIGFRMSAALYTRVLEVAGE